MVKHPNLSIGEQNQPKSSQNHSKLVTFYTPKSSVPMPSTSSASSTSMIFSLDDEIEAIPESFVTMSNPIKEAFLRAENSKEGGAKHNAITQAILFFICKDMRPFHVVEGRGFRNLMNVLAPSYTIPSQNTLKRKFNEKFEMCFEHIKAQLMRIDNFCMTTDIWTDSMNERSYLGVTLHFLEDQAHRSVNIGVTEMTSSHTGQYISRKLQCFLNEFGVDENKLITIVTDNGANMVAAAHLLTTKNKHIGCFAHTLNLVVDSALKHLKVEPIVTKVRQMVKWVKNSVNCSDRLRMAQKSHGVPEGDFKKLILDVATRWNSTFYMIERFLEMASLLTQISLDVTGGPEMPSSREMLDLKELVVLLRPFEFVTRELSGEKYSTLSRVIPTINTLKLQIERVTIAAESSVKNVKFNLLAEMEKRFSHIESNANMAIATILDPRFKTVHFRSPENCASALKLIRKGLKKQDLDKPLTSSSDEEPPASDYNFWEPHKELVHGKKLRKNTDDQLSHYLSAKISSLRTDPLQEWEEMKTVYPSLYKQARIVLMLLATSVPCERLFSKTGSILTQTRNKLSPKHLSRLVFLSGVDDEMWGV